MYILNIYCKIKVDVLYFKNLYKIYLDLFLFILFIYNYIYIFFEIDRSYFMIIAEMLLREYDG